MLVRIPAWGNPYVKTALFFGTKCGIAWRRFIGGGGVWLAQESELVKEGNRDFVRVGQTATDW